MKALFNRFNRTKEKERETPKEKVIDLPPLPEWPPRLPTNTTTNSTTNTVTPTAKPLPELTPRPLPPIEAPSPLAAQPPTRVSPRTDHDALGLSIATRTTSPRPELDSQARTSRKTTNGSTTTATVNGDAPKKVAFLSPPPTPGPERAMSPDASPDGPLKNPVSRFQATHGRDTRSSTSTAPKLEIGPSKANNSAKATSTRTATSPNSQKTFADGASVHQSVRSGTPYSQMTNNSSRILATASWSEAAEEDLVTNLGSRERTRQEVLWEIVASEERYVAELIKMKETFIEPLLHPFSAASPVTSTMVLEQQDEYMARVASPNESLEHLPIASRFLSPTLGLRSDTPSASAHAPSTKDDTPIIDGESLDTDDEEADQVGKGFTDRKASGSSSTAAKLNHPRSPYGSTAIRSTGKPTKGSTSVPFPSRSHQSLPPPPRVNQLSASTTSLGRASYVGGPIDRDQQAAVDRKATSTPSSKVVRKLKKSMPTTPDRQFSDAVAPHQLPEDLRQCLEVIEGGILNGHLTLSEGLRKRYEEQYPLVRSLADVFVTNSHILHEYATYVLHLERALEQVDNALSTANATKRPKKQDAAEWLKICKFLQKLEETAADKGETGLAISLSKPFQRLLKYPLLFQNLLFHTDPSTFEYESTLQMVAEVETIVRSIEDEKIQKEDRDRTRDVFARIEGLDKVKQLAVPKPSRLLVEERLLSASDGISKDGKPSSPPPANAAAVKGKTSFKRLSDVLQSGSNGIGGKRDLWLVVFNDVVLRCQRTGTTSLPLVAATNSRTTSMPELQGKTKYATTGRRNSHTKPRNMYKFIKIETWDIGNAVQPHQGVVAMEDMVRAREQVHSTFQSVPMPEDDEDDGAESDESDRKSKMSFSYWGADKITVQKPVVKGRYMQPNGNPRRPVGGAPSSYGRESSANAKFGHRLVSADSSGPARPASRRTQATTTSQPRRATASDDSHSAKATVTSMRPAWDSSFRSPSVSTTTPVTIVKRPRNLSQTSGATSLRQDAKQLASPAPSEDSGVGLYRQMMANNPSLNKF